ncbi:hypothetical protein PHMEG_0006435 [Phytophthora megakarya]|uniref:Uncharacterized protein n=1 Tax=Phytophthora megakarya TaxID=4795 RepID=A0A225WNV9_9STRA|nr:hypothetical protein PHMEG_0006435 [Phytophthora megakarya]
MATVRTPTPRGSDAGNKRKRKRPNKPKTMSSCSASSTVDTQLQSLESWQRALTIDIRELRREGARVRIELEKVDDTAEAAVEKAENWRSSISGWDSWTRSWRDTSKAASMRSSLWPS